MSKPPGKGRCIHCLQEVETRNWDHVLPSSWYPDSTPTNMEKWKVPSCAKCNAEYGRLEKELLITIGLCLDATDPDISSVIGKVLRSLDPNSATKRKDRRARERDLDKVKSRLMKFQEVSEESVYPGFGPRAETDEHAALAISKEGIEKMAEKIVRGIVFKESGQFIGDDYKVESYVLRDEDAEPIVSMIAHYGGEINRGTGLSVVRAVLPEDPQAGIYAITIWKQLKIYVFAGPHGIEGVAE